MGRKSLANERQEQILDAFEVCIRQYGLDGSSLEKIAEEAGVKRAIIRHYIGNRDDLIAAAVSRIIAGFQEELTFAIESLTPAELIPALLDHLFCYEDNEEISDYDTLVQALWATKDRDPQTHKQLLNLYHQFENIVLDALNYVFPDSPLEQRQQVAFGIMCLANDTWSMVDLGFDKNRYDYGRFAAETLITTLDI